MKGDEMGRACGMHGEKRELHIDFWSENLKKRDHLEDLCINRMIILK
jgi:hypothetical protein